MRNFDSVIYAELQKENLMQFFMLELRCNATYRFNETDIDIFHDVTETSGSKTIEHTTSAASGYISGVHAAIIPNDAHIDTIMIYNTGAAAVHVSLGDTDAAPDTLVAPVTVAPLGWMNLTLLKDSVTANDIYLAFSELAAQVCLIRVAYHLNTP